MYSTIPKCHFKVIFYKLGFLNVVSVYDLCVGIFTIFDVITVLPKFRCYSIVEPLHFISCVFSITFITTILHVIITLNLSRCSWWSWASFNLYLGPPVVGYAAPSTLPGGLKASGVPSLLCPGEVVSPVKAFRPSSKGACQVHHARKHARGGDAHRPWSPGRFQQALAAELRLPTACCTFRQMRPVYQTLPDLFYCKH